MENEIDMSVTLQNLLKGRLAFVTGAGSGIGAALAKGLAAHGASVIVAGRTTATLTSTVDAIKAAGGVAQACVLDVSDGQACTKAAERIGREIGDVSIVVNAAGVIRDARFDSPGAREAWNELMAINLSGPFNVALAFLPQLRRTRGSVVNIGSIAGFIYTSNTPAYSASKGGLHMLTVALARELGPDGIRVNAVAPGAIATAMTDVSDERKMKALARRAALGRPGSPDEMVGPVVFLASEMSTYVTGTVVVADGGYLTN
ncbi:MAG: SDR family NAD(P)-dependent oxidoreductase [Rhodoferax sp.]